METKYELNRRVYRDGDVVIYQRPNLKDPKWQCRVHVPGGTGYVIKSTKTKDEFEARRFAEELWEDLRHKVRSGGKVKSKSVGKLLTEFESFYQQTATTPRRFEDVTGHLKTYIIPFLAKRPIESIDSNTVVEYTDWRRKPENYVRRQPKNNTIRAELTSFKVFIDWRLNVDIQHDKSCGNSLLREKIGGRTLTLKTGENLQDFSVSGLRQVRRNRVVVATESD